MVNYNCDSCGFLSTNKKDYTRHIKTNKHLQKVKQDGQTSITCPTVVQQNPTKFKCKYCENVYMSQSSRSKHMKNCINNVSNIITKEKDNEIKDIKLQTLENEIKRVQQEAKEKEEILKKQLSTYEQLLKSMTTPQTINYYNYIVQTYPNAPALEGQKTYNNLLESKISSLMDIISMYYYDNKLVSFIGDYLIKLYTHKEPKNQSIWTTDISRLTYIISESNKDGNIWSYDKKGSKIKKIMIEPVLQYIREQLFEYCQSNGGSSKANILKKMIAANEVIQLIDSGELLDKINKYIAPEFSVKQGDNNGALVKI
ncbi:hypothetical protein Indivirus_15_2 [Indivirus ILV1]|uniref:C2H2-type domain-containing protein n=1 Tax=Indivirus ILV1 TaxID=1977633 RepID=A0A1V0SEG3_9VIRU|nr:hypothetical protein Indivirus_15_2 [Indivirus ILV1]